MDWMGLIIYHIIMANLQKSTVYKAWSIQKFDILQEINNIHFINMLLQVSHCWCRDTTGDVPLDYILRNTRLTIQTLCHLLRLLPPCQCELKELVTVLNASQWKWPSRVSITSASFFSKEIYFWRQWIYQDYQFQDYIRYGLELAEYHLLESYDGVKDKTDETDRVFLESVQVCFFSILAFKCKDIWLKSRILDVLFIQALASIFCTFYIPILWY